MLSKTLDNGLKSYGIGGRLRALRLRKKMGLVELGRHSGLSAAMLSKIERGLVYPTLPTLLRVALVFSVDLGFFFTATARKARRRSGTADGTHSAARAARRTGQRVRVRVA